MIIQNPEEDEYPEQAALRIRDALSEIKRQHALPYELEISVGYEALGDRDDTLKACTIRADEKLYREKRIKG